MQASGIEQTKEEQVNQDNPNASQRQFLSKKEVSQILGYSVDTFTKNTIANPPHSLGLDDSHVRVLSNGVKQYSVEYIERLCLQYNRKEELQKLQCYLSNGNTIPQKNKQDEKQDELRKKQDTLALLQDTINYLASQLQAKDQLIDSLCRQLERNQALLMSAQEQTKEFLRLLPGKVREENNAVEIERTPKTQKRKLLGFLRSLLDVGK